MFMSKEYITLAELSKMLKISRATIDRWRKEGMPSYKIGNGVRFIEADVHAWIAKHKSEQKSKQNTTGEN
jgi:excisionase family DNA binding protein